MSPSRTYFIKLCRGMKRCCNICSLSGMKTLHYLFCEYEFVSHRRPQPWKLKPCKAENVSLLLYLPISVCLCQGQVSPSPPDLSPCLFSYSSLLSFFFGLRHRRRKTHRKDRRSDLFKDQCVINHKLAALREEEMYDSSLCGFLSLSSWHFLILVLLFNKWEFLSSPPICVTDQGLYLLPLILFKNGFPII